ncbi:MAG: MBL fold metallo-hydrolase [Deltaproteobacteria bacterium]|nr:MBL fold metallo-hydrolase [Deltaproteobacteria bacterium]
MINRSSGKIAEGLYAIGDYRLPAYLLIGETPTLFDAGMNFMGPRYLQEIKASLGDPNRLRYLLLTHSHFDHCGAAPFLKRKIPGLKVGASPKAAEVFAKPKAIQLIQALSRNAQENFDPVLAEKEDVSFDALEVDLLLEDGQELDLGEGRRVQVMATPGHTRDALSYYLPHLKALVTGEAVGIYTRQLDVQPEFLSSYEDYVGSLKRMSALEVEILMIGHVHVLTGDDARSYLAQSLEGTRRFRERIEDYLHQLGGKQEAVVQRIFHEDYEVKQTTLQDVQPYLINLAAKVKAVAQKK